MACVAYNNPPTAFLSFHQNQFTKPFSLNRPSFSVFVSKPKRCNPIHSTAIIRESYLFPNSSPRLSSFSGEFKRFAEHSQKSGCISAITFDYYDKAPEERLVVLVIGGGGREHAICFALQRSPSVDGVFCLPGNDGIANSGCATCVHGLDISDSSKVISFCQEWGVKLVVVGPEAPLVAGLSDILNKAGIPTFGPSAEAAALEGSKDFMKRLCYKYGIPTAKYQTFTDPSAAKQYIQEQGVPIVIKADGLAAGKGVVVAMTLDEAYEAVDSMLVKGVFGSAGCHVIVEEFLEGEEASFFALVDGETAIPLESAQDHKRVGDGDTGPNTGGMGAYSPAPIVTEDIKSFIMKSIILPTVKGMSEEGCKFVGVLFAGLMIEKRTGLPKLIEYNVRFGDPECQVLMVRLESDLAQALLAACRGELNNVSLKWSSDSAMVVVMASKGYPGKYMKDTVIRNLKDIEEMLKEEEREDKKQVSSLVKVFHAGTSTNQDGNYIAVGGRVLGVTATGKDLKEARDKAYETVEKINWPEGFLDEILVGEHFLRNHFGEICCEFSVLSQKLREIIN